MEDASYAVCSQNKLAHGDKGIFHWLFARFKFGFPFLFFRRILAKTWRLKSCRHMATLFAMEPGRVLMPPAVWGGSLSNVCTWRTHERNYLDIRTSPAPARRGCPSQLRASIFLQLRFREASVFRLSQHQFSSQARRGCPSTKVRRRLPHLRAFFEVFVSPASLVSRGPLFQTLLPWL